MRTHHEQYVPAGENVQHDQLPVEVCPTNNVLHSARLISSQLWADLSSYVRHPSEVKEKSARMNQVIQKIARIASHLAEEFKGTEGAISGDVAQALFEVSEMPLKKTSPKCETYTSDAEEPKKTQRSKKKQKIESTKEMYRASTPESSVLLPPVNPSTPLRRTQPVCSLTLSKRGNGFLAT